MCKKSGFSLVGILITMSIVMVAIVAATPIITSRLTKITIGKADDTSINFGQKHGAYLCYKDTNNQFRYVRVDKLSNGRVTEEVGEGCLFQIPMDADSYKVTLIGAGGGGLATTARFDDDGLEAGATEETRKDDTTRAVINFTLIFGENATPLNLEMRDMDGFATSATMRAAYATFFQEHDIHLIVSAISGHKFGGVEGQGSPVCCYNAAQIVGYPVNHIRYRSGTLGETFSSRFFADFTVDGVAYHNNQGYISADTSTFVQSGGIQPGQGYNGTGYPITCPVVIGTTSVNPIYGSRPTTEQRLEGPPAGFYEGGCRASLTEADRIKGIGTKITIPTIQVYRGYVGGAPGHVETKTVPFLAKYNETTVDFSDPNVATIGEGGQSGNAETCTPENSAACSGLPGGNTTFRIITGQSGAELVNQLNGLGGAGVDAPVPETVSSVLSGGSYIINNEFEPGVNGVKSNTRIPDELARLANLTSSPVAKGATCENPDGPRNGEDATYPGAGGGSGCIRYSLSGGSTIIEMGINTNTALDVVGTPSRATATILNGSGGKGANGAIVIEW